MTPLIPLLLAAALLSGCGYDFVSEPWPDDHEFGQEGRDGPPDRAGPADNGDDNGENGQD